MPTVHGHTTGLKPSQVRALERVYHRKVPRDRVLPPDLAHYLCETSLGLLRQIGLLIDRRGRIEAVVVGDARGLELPEVGRLRAGAGGRLRGVRWVHTHLRGEDLTSDDLADLARLRLDLVAAIEVLEDGRAGKVRLAHLLPENAGGALWEVLPWVDVHECAVDPAALAGALEEEFARRWAGRATVREGAILVHVSDLPPHRAEASLAELAELARSAGVDVLDTVRQTRPAPDPRTILGRGKLQELFHTALQLGAEVIIFDQDLRPNQVRAIAQATDLKILDRTMLILDIFAQRARTRDGKLQVELAQLHYALPRLVERDDSLSRLTGGIGGRGPGETALEEGRRRVRARIRHLEKQIGLLSRRRQVRRGQRAARRVPIVAIVGYTNAGKSSLLNALTGSEVEVESKLFATLDPTSRRLRFPRDREIVLTDTVGFIQDLPQDLVNAFRATLEELADADLLLHLVDAADAEREQKMAAVERLLADLDLARIPRLLVFNKIDLLDPREARARAARARAIPVSALDVQTTLPLLRRMERALWASGRRC